MIEKKITHIIGSSTGKQRLVINASSTVVSPNVVLTLQPYACQTVAGQVACPTSGIYNPDPALGGVGNVFTNNGAGTYMVDGKQYVVLASGGGGGGHSVSQTA